MISVNKENNALVITIATECPEATASGLVNGLLCSLRNMKADEGAYKLEWSIYNICDILEAMMPDENDYAAMLKPNEAQK